MHNFIQKIDLQPPTSPAMAGGPLESLISTHRHLNPSAESEDEMVVVLPVFDSLVELKVQQQINSSVAEGKNKETVIRNHNVIIVTASYLLPL